MASKRETRNAGRGDRLGRGGWPLDVRLAAARAVVDEGLSAHAVAPRFGVPYTTLLEWSRK